MLETQYEHLITISPFSRIQQSRPNVSHYSKKHNTERENAFFERPDGFLSRKTHGRRSNAVTVNCAARNDFSMCSPIITLTKAEPQAITAIRLDQGPSTDIGIGLWLDALISRT